MSMILRGSTAGCVALLSSLNLLSLNLARADEQQTMRLGPVTMVAPKDWKAKDPAVRIITYEFAAPKAKDDKEDGRFLVMAAGGTVEANIERWYGQFTQEDGADTKKRSKLEDKTIAGQKVHLVDISGTYKDQRGPMTPAVNRKDYRMLGAIIETADGNLFLKFYGPKRTIAENEKAFRQMIEEMKSK